MVNQEYEKLGNSPNVIRELFMYGLEQKKKLGAEHVFDFTLGNPSIPAPEEIKTAIVTMLNTEDPIKIHGYSPSAGDPVAREAVAADLSSRFGMDVKPGEIFLTCGAAPALISVIKALMTENGSEIMVLAPFFMEYRPFIESNGGKCVVVPPDTRDFSRIDTKAVESLISERTQGVIVNSPNNPTGAVYPESELKALAAVLERKSAEFGHPIYIIADEPYRELVYDDVEVPFIPLIYKNTVVCYSYSKSLSLPGERIGYVYVPSFAEDSEELFNAVAGAARITGHICAPTIIQKVIAACASKRPDLKAYDENRRLLYENLRDIGYECVKPQGAFYLFVKAPNGDANVFSQKAKLGHNLLVVPSDAFECPGYLRVSYCVSKDTIINSIPAFRAMMNEIKG